VVKKYAAIAICLLSALSVAYRTTFATIELVAFIWLLTGLWLAGQLRRLSRSPREIYAGYRTGEAPMPSLARLMVNGGLLLGAINPVVAGVLFFVR
jgi:hypothetical protein